MSTEPTDSDGDTGGYVTERRFHAVINGLLDRIEELERQIDADDGSRTESEDSPTDAVIPLFAKKQLQQNGYQLTTEERRAIKLWNEFQDYDTYRNNKWIIQTSTALKILGDDLQHSQAHRAMMKLGELGEEYVTYYTPEENPSRDQHMVEITKRGLAELKSRVEGSGE